MFQVLFIHESCGYNFKKNLILTARWNNTSTTCVIVHLLPIMGTCCPQIRSDSDYNLRILHVLKIRCTNLTLCILHTSLCRPPLQQIIQVSLSCHSICSGGKIWGNSFSSLILYPLQTRTVQILYCVLIVWSRIPNVAMQVRSLQ